jgi:hypothetical protein
LIGGKLRIHFFCAGAGGGSSVAVWQCGSSVAVWQCVAVCGSVWQCVAVCGSVWQWLWMFICHAIFYI